MSARTQISYLSPSLAPAQPSTSQPRNKLHRTRPEGNVLPARSLRTPGPSSGYQRELSYVTGYSAYNQAGYGNGLAGASEPGSSTGRGTGYGRLQGALQQAKESRQQKRTERVKRGEVTSAGQVVDEDGVAHDSEYVRFRTATPVHLQKARDNGNDVPNDDDSASSSSSESSHGESERSAFPSSPYTYQSTPRTSTSTHHYPSKLTGTGRAIPTYLNTAPHRTSVDYAGLSHGHSLAVPRAPSPRRVSAEFADRPTSIKSSTKSKRNGTSHQPTHQFTTSSYQPPAPAFSTFGAPAPTLRLPPKPPSSDGGSLHGSLGKLSLGSTTGTSTAENGASGYNKLGSSRPPRTEGSAMDAGVHGMKRSWDGFKLDMRFSAHKATSKVSRKINSSLGI